MESRQPWWASHYGQIRLRLLGQKLSIAWNFSQSWTCQSAPSRQWSPGRLKAWTRCKESICTVITWSQSMLWTFLHLCMVYQCTIISNFLLLSLKHWIQLIYCLFSSFKLELRLLSSKFPIVACKEQRAPFRGACMQRASQGDWIQNP